LKVLVLGYGEMGHAMEYLLGSRVDLAIWEKWPKPGFRPAVLEQAAPQADLVLFCLPAAPHYEVALQLLPLLRESCVCMGIAKGLDEAGRTAAQVFAEVFGDSRPFALMYGPMIAEEIRAGRYAYAQVACSKEGLFATLKDLFAETGLHVQEAADMTGISWSVILKNVYAMLFGMADELRLGANTRGYLAVASLSELDRIVVRMGGLASSPYHLAGLGDLVATATSADSHHHELGRRLARGETAGIEGEGVHTLEMMTRHHLLDLDDYPLFGLIRNIVLDPGNGRERLDDWLRHSMD
jgi:glycerol-3-phosphate dehydrogenase (NAD(P)+)